MSPQAALCLESCRIEHPPSLKGEYVRNRYYSDLRLISWYGGSMRNGLHLFSLATTNDPIIDVPWREGYGHHIDLMVDVAVASQATIYSRSVDQGHAWRLSLMCKATSASSTPSLRLRWESGPDRPATEQIADTTYVVSDQMSDIFSGLVDEIWHVKQFFPSLSPFGRLIAIGNADNPADTILNAKLYMESHE